MNEERQEKTRKEFMELIRNISDNQFWAYVRVWADISMLIEQMVGWDIETKKRAIKEIKDIMKRVS